MSWMFLSWLLACGGSSERQPEVEAAPTAPRAVVLVVVEGLSAETAKPLRSTLSHGLGRLSKVALAARAYHGHQTLTVCPGHATLSTGASPSVHGIPADRWWLDDATASDCWEKDNLLADTLADQVRIGGGQVVVLAHDVAAGTLYSGRSTGASAWLTDGAWASGWQGPPAWIGTAPPSAPEGIGQAATNAIETLALGEDEVADLLVITSALDPTDPSAALASLDLALAPVAEALDQRAGERGWTLVFTASHGLGEVLEPIDSAPLLAAAAASVTDVYSEGTAHFAPPDLYLPQSVRRPNSLKDGVNLSIRTRLGETHPDWDLIAWTELDGLDPEHPRTPQIERGTYGLRSGDLLVFPPDGKRFAEADERAHSPYVPLWAKGPGVAPMGLRDAVDTRDLAPTLAAWLGVASPDNAEGTAVLQ